MKTSKTTLYYRMATWMAINWDKTQGFSSMQDLRKYLNKEFDSNTDVTTISNILSGVTAARHTIQQDNHTIKVEVTLS